MDLNVPAKLAAFAVALVATFALSYGVGSAVGPIGNDPAPTSPVATTTTMAMDHGGHP